MPLFERLRAGIHAMTAPGDVFKAASAPADQSLAVPSTGGAQTPLAAAAPQISGASRPQPGALPPEADLISLLRYQFSYGQNALITPRRTEKNPFILLRQLAEFSHIRNCIEARKDQMTSLQLEITPRDKRKSEISDDRVAAVKAFFEKPDKKRSWNSWLRMLIEEVMVIDALSIYRRKTFGGQLYSAEIIDGSTILPMIDARGDTPDPPNVAYRQIIYGRPIKGGDCTTDDLLYRPRVVRAHTPYGMSPTEWVMLAINSVINRDVFNLAWYTEGNIPDSIVDAPLAWSTDQIREFEAFVNLKLAGALGQRRKMKVLQNGMAKSFKQLKDPDFTSKYDEWLLKIICAAFAVPPSELGFTNDAGSKNTAKQQENVVYRRGVKPLTNFVCDIINELIAVDLNEPGLEATLTGGEPEDKLTQARTDQIYVTIGKVSVDELRTRDGEEPIGMGNYIMTGSGPQFVSELINPDPDDNDNTTDVNLEEQQQLEGKGQQSEKPGEDGADEEGAALETELKKWFTVAHKRAKAGKVQKNFITTVIPEEMRTRIQAALETCKSSNDVYSVFSNVKKYGRD